MPPRKTSQVEAENVRGEILSRGLITLADVASLIYCPPDSAKLFNPQEEKRGRIWKRYFQSPVDKAASLVGTEFKFNHQGALQKGEAAKKFLLRWLELSDNKAIHEWLERGTILPREIQDKIRTKLEEETLANHDLYNQPICRLVRSDQLRYDPHYQALYQLTPAQLRLINSSQKSQSIQSEQQIRLEQVNRNRRIYWGISPVFQSLVAMFDSELGGVWRDEHGQKIGSVRETEWGRETKEFIRIEFEDAIDSSEPEKGAEPQTGLYTLTPSELNEYSPLRFWAPPHAFARSVFHMIFWRSVITNKDLYGRPVIINEDKTLGAWERIVQRVDFYYIIINWYNAATYRIAAYSKLFQALMAVADRLSHLSPRQALKNCTEDVLLDTDKSIEHLFLPNEIQNMSVRPLFDNPPHPKFMLPFKTIGAEICELARRYQAEQNGKTQVSDILEFIRDRALELILWSKHQMEIRSIGTVPIQHLYRIEIAENCRQQLIELVEGYDRVIDSSPSAKKKEYGKINKVICDAIKRNEIDTWVNLKKVYGGMHREIVDRGRFNPKGNIKWLLKPSVVERNSEKEAEQ